MGSAAGWRRYYIKDENGMSGKQIRRYNYASYSGYQAWISASIIASDESVMRSESLEGRRNNVGNTD
jgi:hypothetical protein